MLWCTTREGDVLHIDPLSGAYETVLSLNVNDGGVEPGLLGMALHPEWDTTPKVYLAYTAFGNQERLERVRLGRCVVGQRRNPAFRRCSRHPQRKPLVGPARQHVAHEHGGSRRRRCGSQDDNDDNGKILRFNLDGTIPADNPDPNSYVFTKGHRNSQGLCLGPNDVIYSSEHGQYNFDEFNILEAGRNYGWPDVEGSCDGVCDWCDAWNEVDFCNENNVPEPLRTWSPCAAVNDVIYYDHPAIPEWQGSVLMAAFGRLPRSGRRPPQRVAHERRRPDARKRRVLL